MSKKKQSKNQEMEPKEWSVSVQGSMLEKKMYKRKTRRKIVAALKRIGMNVHDIRVTEISSRIGTGEDTSR